MEAVRSHLTEAPGVAAGRLVEETEARTRTAPIATIVRVWISVLTGVVAGLAFTPSAEATSHSLLPGGCCLYWATGSSGTIGRAGLDGFYPDANFIRAGTPAVFGLATDAEHIFWGGEGSIGRADLPGGNPDDGFISPLAESREASVAVDDAHVYWAEPAENRIGRANLDGSGVDESFIQTPFPAAVAVDSEHLYWAAGLGHSIGRANLDGTDVEPSFITAPDLPAALAVDSTHIYWTSFGTETIGRANLDGSGVVPTFLDVPGDPWGIALDSTHLYWSDLSTGTIARANLDGSDVDSSFIEGVGALELTVGKPGTLGAAKARKTQVEAGKKVRIRVKVEGFGHVLATAIGSLTLRSAPGHAYHLKQTPRKFLRLHGGVTEATALRPTRKRQERHIAAALHSGGHGTAEIRIKLSDDVSNVEFKRLKVKVKGSPQK